MATVEQKEVPVVPTHGALHHHPPAVGGHAGLDQTAIRIADRAQRRARPIEPRQLARAHPARPVGHQPGGGHRHGALTKRLDRHGLGQRHRLARERGLRDIQSLGHERARSHPQQPAVARGVGAPTPGRQVHPGTVSRRQPRRDAPIEHAQIRSRPHPPRRWNRTGTGGRPAETAGSGGSTASGRVSSWSSPRPRWRTRASTLSSGQAQTR